MTVAQWFEAEALKIAAGSCLKRTSRERRGNLFKNCKITSNCCEKMFFNN